EDLTIFRNIIQHCGLQMPAEIPAQLTNEIAFGGIVLGDTVNARIQENRVEDNGKVTGKPVCGVYLRYGEQIEISGNTIIRNGLPLVTRDQTVQRGVRAGIMIRMGFKTADLKNVLTSTVPSFDGVPAISIHDNVVEQPLGHALYGTAFGPVSVVNNQFTSLGADRTNPQSTLASTVFLFDLGVSKDFVVTMIKSMANKSPAANQQYLNDPAARQLVTGLQYLPSGKLIFSDNQVTLDMRSPAINLSVSSILVLSLDDIAFNNNQSECAGYLSLVANDISFDLVILNSLIIGASVRTNDNRFMEGVTLALYSLLSYGLMNTALGNQSTHCLLTLGTLRSVADNLVLNSALCNDKQLQYAKALSVPMG
ncbi:MAG TPA: hypothetical protein VKA08_15705, partial [Balneolales bacterium]|nr:hypothetical protein [Balneolales bacterium]